MRTEGDEQARESESVQRLAERERKKTCAARRQGDGGRGCAGEGEGEKKI